MVWGEGLTIAFLRPKRWLMVSQGVGSRSRFDVDGVLGFDGHINKVDALADGVFGCTDTVKPQGFLGFDGDLHEVEALVDGVELRDRRERLVQAAMRRARI